MAFEDGITQPEPAGDPPQMADTSAATSAKFTPGPLVVWSSLYEGFTSAVVSDRPGQPLKTLAEVRQYKDALLYAAAPDLYEALRLLVADVADYPAWQRPCHALDVARAALAQAGA